MDLERNQNLVVLGRSFNCFASRDFRLIINNILCYWIICWN